MKYIYSFIILLSLSNKLAAQKALFSVGTGFSGVSSDYKNYYSKSVNFNAKLGYEKYVSDKVGLRGTLGIYNYRSNLTKLETNLSFNFIKLSSGFLFKLNPSLILSSSLQLGTPLCDARKESPRFDYIFDPVNTGFSLEIAKTFSIDNCVNCYALSIEYSRSIDGVNNQSPRSDVIVPYYLNINFYYFLDESTKNVN